MALFGRKKEDKASETTADIDEAVKQEVVKEVKQKKVKKAPELSVPRNLSSIIKKPRITEKAVLSTENNVYAFEVAKEATKHDVRDAVKEIFGVTPIKVNIVHNKTRHTMSRFRGRSVKSGGLKKAYVYLRDGDRIDLA